MSAFDQRLLTERSREGDLLQHRPLAKAIAKVIRDTPKDESIGLALYGAWGQGKSTIGGLVEECLDSEETDERYVFVRIDAWKYAHEGERQPLRRHYLLRAYEAAGLYQEAEKLRRAFAQKVISHGLDEGSTAFAFFHSLWERARRKWHYTVPFIIGLAALWKLAPTIVPALVVAVLGGIGAILVAVSAMVDVVARVLTAGLTVTTEEDPFRSVEEFDDQFTTLLKTDAAGVDRFVFFIDDLDRCKDDLVVEAIETLQAFFGRARCAYIVAADERQLKRAVRATASGPVEVASPRSVIPMDETFLEKIFQVTVLVPPLYDENLLAYAQSVCSQTGIAGLPEPLRDDVLGYLVHAEVVSPRQVRVIINDFLLALAEATEREAEGETFLDGARLTSAPLLLAKMVVLRSHFPWFHRLLFARPELAIWWPETFGTPSDQWTDYQKEADRVVRVAAGTAVGESRAFAAPVDDSESGVDGSGQDSIVQEGDGVHPPSDRVEALVAGLRGYLILTGETVPDDPARVEEFLYLRGRAGFAGLTGESGQLIRQVLQTGDVARLEQVFSADGADPASATDAALDRMVNGSRLERASARRALQGIITFLSPADLSARGTELVSALYGDLGERKVQEDDLEARRLLVPWMGRGVLIAHAEQAWPEEFADLREVLTRAAELNAESEIGDAIADHLDDQPFIEAVGAVFAEAGAPLADQYTLTASSLSRRFGRPKAAR